MARRRAPVDFAAIRRSRSGYTGAVTKAHDKLKLMDVTEVEALATIKATDVSRQLASIERTHQNFLLTMEEAQEFAPDGDEAEDAFQTEELIILDRFEDAFLQARELACHLLTLKSVQVGLEELVLDIRTLETTLHDRPDGDHTHRFDNVESAYSNLRQEWRKAGLPSTHSLKSELDSCTMRIDALAADTAAAKHRATVPSVPVPSHSLAPARPDRSYTKLPAISLPTYNGNVLKWPTFWHKFQAAVDSNGELPDSTKLSYLRGAIKDPEADIILNPSIDGPDTYNKLVKELQQRYERTKRIHRELVEKLVHLPSAKHNAGDLRRLVDATINCVDCLQTTGQFTLEALISSLVYSKLPYKLQIDWDDDQDDDTCVQPYHKLLDYVTKKAFTLADHRSSPSSPSVNNHHQPERKQIKKEKPPPHKKTPVYSVSSPSTPPSTPTQSSYRWDCSYCKPEKHPLHLCPKWLGFSTEQRLTQVRDRKLCANCLSVGHATNLCKSTYRCRDCGGNHHTTIHKTPPPVVPVNSTISTSQQLPDALLMTAMVLLKGPNGKQTKARAFLDPGAGLSLITSKMAQLLDLPLESSRTTFTTVQGTRCQGSRFLTNLTISSLHQHHKEFQCRPAVVQKVTESIPNKMLASVEDFPHLTNLQLADPGFNVPGKVDILLGADLWLQLQGTEPPITASTSEPGAQDTVFGWVLAGPIHSKEAGPRTVSTCHLQPPMSNDELYSMAYNFWLAESADEPEAPLSVQDKQVETQYTDNVSYSPQSCRYQVTLPRKPDYQPLGESRPQAAQRYFSNETSILRKGVHKAFQEQIQGYLDAGHAEPVPPADLTKEHFYLPMHSVVKQSSTTTKLRVVFDGSASTTSGASLNSILHVGPTLHPTLANILIKFRTYPVALTADVSKMYREVELHSKDRDLHRFVWRPTPKDSLQDYRMRRVTFGVKASPYLAIRTLQQTARDHATELPNVYNHVHSSFYVDDLLAGANTPEEALDLYQDLRSILLKGGFNLCKWRSSDTTVLHNIPLDLQETVLIKEDTTLQESAQPKALGLQWDSQLDHMSPSIHTPSSYRTTKRGIISDVSKTFDVLGWIAPAVLPMKILFQSLWEKEQEWDGSAPPSVIEEHSKWRQQLPCLSSKHLPRCYTIPSSQSSIITQELQGFSDASQKALGAVVYLRTTYSDHPPTISLVTAKTKVAKRNSAMTIPKLELSGAVLLTKLLITTAAVLDIPLDQTTAWTDSSIVLNWLDGNSRDSPRFIANRVAYILNNTKPQTWRHIPTQDNPADCASRGMMPLDLLEHNLWWQGPEFLYQDPIPLPPQPPRKSAPDDQQMQLHAIINQAEFASSFEQRTNNYNLIVSMVAWWFRLFYRLREGRPNPDNRSKILSTLEYQTAEQWLFRQSQRRTFSKEQLALSKGLRVASSSRLKALTPTIDKNGLIRVRGRLGLSKLSTSQQHPVILDGRDSLIKKLFLSEHIRLSHCGPSLLLCHSNNQLHIVGAKRLSRDVCSSCVSCRRVNPRPVPQIMGDLPLGRTQTQQPAFSHTGMDFAGPFDIRQGHTRRPVKIEAYICIFVCLATKAIHLEVTSALSTEAFTACLKRFIARRNCPTTLHCDNGSNFVGARNELQRLYTFLSNRETDSYIQQFLLKQQVQWQHIPAASPHFGGLWESAVRSLKKHLRRLMGTLLLTFEELTTITCQIEACLNSRPLTPINSHSQDGIMPLTAGHFLFLDAPRAYPMDPTMHEEPRLLQRFKQCQSVVSHFWDRWSQEYLTTLQARTKWKDSKPNLQVGDVVIFKPKEQFVCRWPIARIKQVYPGTDGKVRVALIQPAIGEARQRPVTKLSLLYRAEPQDTHLLSSPGSMFRPEDTLPEQEPDPAPPPSTQQLPDALLRFAT